MLSVVLTVCHYDIHRQSFLLCLLLQATDRRLQFVPQLTFGHISAFSLTAAQRCQEENHQSPHLDSHPLKTYVT